LHRAALAANALMLAYRAIVEDLLRASNVARERVTAIGAHGQTVRHRPREFDGIGYSVQLANPALLAEWCGIDVVADLRSRDIAAGGQGAPLVPAFHRAVFARPGQTTAVLNIGGISNLTVLPPGGATIGFDCGPGNALMDHWCREHTGRPYDSAGAWAASGRVVEPLLARMLGDPYFALPPPKSTGRDRFHPDWLRTHLAPCAPPADAVDVQATLAELTATACATALRGHGADARALRVCGGGAFNAHLMQRLRWHLPGVEVTTTSDCGLPPDQVEGCAFAWLARAFVRREGANLPGVTGAAGLRILGALYPA
jgi:anhydro-N-acetylmuramic acid kinase